MKANVEDLKRAILELKESKIKNIIEQRIKEFQKLGNGTSHELFNELCFCLLTANFSARGGIKIQNAIGDGFLILSKEELAKKLQELGHRFPNARADYIVRARMYADSLKQIISQFDDEKELREWLAKNIKGLGYKEASHFMRNIGFTNVAIIDFHIIDLLVKYGIIERPKTLTRKRYIEIENKLRELAEDVDVNLAELDLYLWYLETGNILK